MLAEPGNIYTGHEPEKGTRDADREGSRAGRERRGKREGQTGRKLERSRHRRAEEKTATKEVGKQRVERNDYGGRTSPLRDGKEKRLEKTSSIEHSIMSTSGIY